MSKFEILCVTMHQNDFSKIEEMNVRSDIVYANQGDHTGYSEYEFNGHKAKMISTETRGVGINRNLALCYASADICLMSDDDVKYQDDMEERIVAEFDSHPDADIIVFNFTSNNPKRCPERYLKTKKCSGIYRTPWGSVRIAFRLNSVRKANVWFTSLFGGGCIFPSGEDSIWIRGLKRSGLVFYVSKEIIGEIDYENSSWFTGFDQKYFYGVGACYAGMKDRLYPLKYLHAVFRTRNRGKLTAMEKLKWLRNGRTGYRKMLSYDDFCLHTKSKA